MSKIKMLKNDDVVILTCGGADYIRVITTPTSPYTIFPGANTVIPGVELWRCTADEDVTIDVNKYIRDNSNLDYYAIVGPRPRNIVRR
jgi:hypothetical protein